MLNKNPSKGKHTMERLHILTQLRKCNHWAAQMQSLRRSICQGLVILEAGRSALLL